MKLIEKIKRAIRHYRVRKYLDGWKKHHHAAGFSHFYVKRKYDATEVYIDLYWHVRTNPDAEHSLDFIYQRCRWRDARKVIHDVEHHQLPHLLRRLDEKRKTE